MIVNCNGVLVSIAAGIAQWKTRTLEVDVDGAPNAYGPDDSKALDALANAGRPGDYWALGTKTGKPDGDPYVQGPQDPFPGMYIAETALFDHAKVESDPTRYLDARVVPYVSVPATLLRAGIGKGDFGVLEWQGKQIGLIVGEVGPGCEEVSYAVHELLGFDPRRAWPHHHLVGADVQATITIYCGTAQAPAWPIANGDVNATALTIAAGR